MRTQAGREPGSLETDAVLIRTLKPADLGRVVAIDAAATGRSRPRYFELMVERAVRQAPFQVSLVAELEERVVGFLVATLYYGEYGVVEPSASIDAVGVLPEHRGQHVGRALMRQLQLNLGRLGIESVRTEVPWDDFDLLAFLRREGFAPSGRLCLERTLDPTAPESD